MQRGPAALTDAELLAIFLRTGVKGKSAVDLARELLCEHDGLRKLLGADQRRFCQSSGLGPAKYAQLQAVLEMSRRYLRQCMDRNDALTNPDDTRDYLITHLAGHPNEVFAQGNRT